MSGGCGQSYAILVKRLAGDGEPGVVERRYTDFLQLYQTVRRRFPTAVAQISFPRKALLGNFSLEVIQSRSTVFQNLLAGLHASHQPELAEFLFRRELTESHTILKEARFEEAAAMLKNVYLIQEKVLEELSYDTYYTLCLLVASLNAVDDAPQAQRFAEIALHYVDRYQTSEMTLPLLTLCTRLWWCVAGYRNSRKEIWLEEEKKLIFHQDNMPAHKCVLAMVELRNLRNDFLGHPLYSLDLAPSDFHLFPQLNKFVSGKRFVSNEEVDRAVDEYFNSLILEKRWTKCVEVK
ncbi:SNX21 [Cordylochernes scorpioides]|uniref:SNX21 n=1 Tax=Cordylochernes scorpioides TaxID=51811 RepID=A0ABY6L6X3_9ARAC|nr:SNX21 [Cordylochernes scorpioides]